MGPGRLLLVRGHVILVILVILQGENQQNRKERQPGKHDVSHAQALNSFLMRPLTAKLHMKMMLVRGNTTLLTLA